MDNSVKSITEYLSEALTEEKRLELAQLIMKNMFSSNEWLKLGLTMLGELGKEKKQAEAAAVQTIEGYLAALAEKGKGQEL